MLLFTQVAACLRWHRLPPVAELSCIRGPREEAAGPAAAASGTASSSKGPTASTSETPTAVPAKAPANASAVAVPLRGVRWQESGGMRAALRGRRRATGSWASKLRGRGGKDAILRDLGTSLLQRRDVIITAKGRGLTPSRMPGAPGREAATQTAQKFGSLEELEAYTGVFAPPAHNAQVAVLTKSWPESLPFAFACLSILLNLTGSSLRAAALRNAVPSRKCKCQSRRAQTRGSP